MTFIINIMTNYNIIITYKIYLYIINRNINIHNYIVIPTINNIVVFRNIISFEPKKSLSQVTLQFNIFNLLLTDICKFFNTTDRLYK